MDLFFYITLFLFILLFSSMDTNIDFDFWARLTVGKSFFQTGYLFSNEFQSFGTTKDFIDHEWGSSLIFYLIQNYLKDMGLFWFKVIVIFITLFIITKIIKLQKKDAKLHFLFFFFILQGIVYNIFSTIRCQTFSFLFFALYLFILEYARKKENYKILWCLPILNILWANTHGGFALGLIIIALYALGEFLNKKSFKPYLYTFLISCSTSLINPYGIKYIYYIFDALALNRTYITEWQSAFFTKGYTHELFKFKLFFFSFIIIYIGYLIKTFKIIKPIKYFKQIDKTKYLILIFTLLISLKSLRFHVFFSYSVIAFCYIDFYKIFNKQLPKNIDNIKEIILLVLIFISTISHLHNYKFINTTKETQYPIYCIEFIKKNNLKGNVFVNFHTGSYVAYKLYPNNYVFMDGRYEEVYDTNLINEMAKVFLAQNYQGFFNKYHCDILIIDNAYPIKKALDEDDNWILVWEDKIFSLYLPKNYKNKKFIQPTKDVNYYYKTKFETEIDWLK